jgi:magnesium transporter
MPATVTRWIDLLDPDEEAVRGGWSGRLHSRALQTLLEPMVQGDEPRPKLESHGDYLFGVLLVPVAVTGEDRLYYQEVDLVLGQAAILTVRKTPSDGAPLDLTGIHEMSATELSAGMVVHNIVDQAAEGFLRLVTDLQVQIDELEDHVEEWTNDHVRRRLSALRHDLLHIRRVLAPTVAAARQVIDRRIELDSGDLSTHEVEVHFSDAYDKLLRAIDGLEAARELIVDARDYHQSKVANDQNEVTKRLTVIAAIVLPPTFIVGLYGQNFPNIPELDWAQGYGFSWVLIVVITVLQLWYFRRKRWI